MSQPIVLITGAHGMVAQRLSQLLEPHYEVRYLTRNASQPNQYEWNLDQRYIDPLALDNVSHIIHLAGAGIADKRWTEQRKHVILESRVAGAQLLCDELSKRQMCVDSFISASASGFYGTHTSDVIYNEDDCVGDDFLSHVCQAWEQSAQQFTLHGVAKRTVILRLGVVLSPHGGALSRMVRPIRLGLGASLGSGRQYMPWVHVDDVCGMMIHSLANSHLSGVYNAVAPESVTNAQFTRLVARQLHRPLFLPSVPSVVLHFLFGSMSDVLLKGSRLAATKIISTGYRFKHPELSGALSALFA